MNNVRNLFIHGQRNKKLHKLKKILLLAKCLKIGTVTFSMYRNLLSVVVFIINISNRLAFTYILFTKHIYQYIVYGCP